MRSRPIKTRVARQMPVFRDFDKEIERLAGTYSWFRRGDNRFKFFAGNSFFENALFDAYDEGVTDFVDYVQSKQLAERRLNHKYAAARDALYRQTVRAKTKCGAMQFARRGV